MLTFYFLEGNFLILFFLLFSVKYIVQSVDLDMSSNSLHFPQVVGIF